MMTGWVRIMTDSRKIRLGDGFGRDGDRAFGTCDFGPIIQYSKQNIKNNLKVVATLCDICQE